MRSTLLVSTAALLAGIGLASAQGMQGGGQSGAAPSAQSQGAQGGAAGQERQSPQSSPSQRSGQAQQGQKEPMQKDTTGQAQRDHRRTGQSRPGRQGSAPTLGQGQRDQQSPTQAQSPQRQDNQQAERASCAGQGAQGASATLTTGAAHHDQQHRASPGDVPRATNVNFSVSVGTTVPTSVRGGRGSLDADRDLPGMAWPHVFRRQRRDHYRRQQSPNHCGASGLTLLARADQGGLTAALSLRLACCTAPLVQTSPSPPPCTSRNDSRRVRPQAHVHTRVKSGNYPAIPDLTSAWSCTSTPQLPVGAAISTEDSERKW